MPRRGRRRARARRSRRTTRGAVSARPDTVSRSLGRIVARVFATALRQGLRTARAAGIRGLGLAFVSYIPLAASFAVWHGVLLFAGLVLHVVVLLALVRLLGAVRAEPFPSVPQVDE